MRERECVCNALQAPADTPTIPVTLAGTDNTEVPSVDFTVQVYSPWSASCTWSIAIELQ